ncbi:sensor domain-containing diguanylate cyclase [Halomonas getboli]|uniref:sensor domain-containing diguanylate cyclase n=1 Tax=Halomonas getboli TaxID=2935862 RepID=UPI001FFECFD7|nr:sensor domain-containing diguanylate cyclase [Halomonas getboli]MCK2183381.1 sensor domain-containing diguanylate cyclase [Halomonas getboli]
MSPIDVMPCRERLEPVRVLELADQLPGLIFQLHRSADGHLHFPLLMGSGIQLLDLEPERLAENAKPALEQIHEDDYPALMAAIERSERECTPIILKFRFHLKASRCRWIAVRAQPQRTETGVLWHGMMLDISEQVAEEERLRQLSDSDALTGLANRRKLLARLDEEISLSNRHATPLSLVMIDLDHFKAINDTWGHLQGDAVLRELADCCRMLLREEDLLARLGGEEFALLLPLTSQGNAAQLAERLRRVIADHHFEGVGSGRITVSLGITEHRVGDARDNLLQRADASLYRAKHRGRNRVVADD